MKSIFIWLVTIIAIVASTIAAYSQQPQFDAPITASGNYGSKYSNGQFHNLSETPVMVKEQGLFASLYAFLIKEDVDSVPSVSLPHVKSDLKEIPVDQNVIVWLGHSSYYLQTDGKKILIDPVFSENASPVPDTNTAFAGSNIYQPDDIPDDIDYLLITHDHWDHLDYPTLDALKSKVKQVITPIGVGSYLEQWGYSSDIIYQGDWYNSFKQDDLEIHILPARHFSGRLLERDQTLWASYAIISDSQRIYFSGDSGYDTYFKQIGEQFGSFDLAVLENGQYDPAWPYIHMMPEETVQAAEDLNAQRFIPSHNGKFKIAHHSWYDPLERVYQAAHSSSSLLITPIVGSIVYIGKDDNPYRLWWRTVEKN